MTVTSTHGAPSAPRPSLRRRAVAAYPVLGRRGYRRYAATIAIVNTSGWMQRIAQDWLVLELTGSVAMVGLTVALQLGPILFLGMWGGVLADRRSKRRLLMLSHAVGGTASLTLAVLVLVLGGWVAGWHVLLAALLLGLVTAVDVPTREAFLPEVAGTANVRQAVALNTTILQCGALLGPALAGVSIALLGNAPAFVTNAVAQVVAVLLLARIEPAGLETVPRLERSRGQLVEAARYARATPHVLWPVVLIGFVSITGINLATVLAAYADDVLRSGASGYSQLTAAVAAGAVLGLICAGRWGQPGLRRLVYLVLGVALLLLVASRLSAAPGLLVVMAAFGFVANVYLVGSMSLVQASVWPHLRGRVLALYTLVCVAAQAASGLLVGAVAQAHGAPAAMVVSAAGPLTGVVVVGLCLARLRGLRPTLVLRDRPGRGWVYIRPVAGSTAVDAGSSLVLSRPTGDG